MKIAIFHNYMDDIGGAEGVVLILGRDLPADVYSTNINREGINNMRFQIEAVKEIGKNPESYKTACLKQAKKFDTKIFVNKIKEKIEDD